MFLEDPGSYVGLKSYKGFNKNPYYEYIYIWRPNQSHVHVGLHVADGDIWVTVM